MKASVIVFPGSNCDRDVKVALEGCGANVTMVWHGEKELPNSDIVILPGGFSYGDYLRCGSIAAQSPIMKEIKAHAEKGGYVLGICNGFQILTETQMVPGTLMRNSGLKFICQDVQLTPANTDSAFTKGYGNKETITIPIAHHDGNYYVEDDELKSLQDNNQIAFRYTDKNPNGSVDNIAGVLNKKGNILGMMPHPERLWEPALGGTDGRILFDSLIAQLA